MKSSPASYCLCAGYSCYIFFSFLFLSSCFNFLMPPPYLFLAQQHLCKRGVNSLALHELYWVNSNVSPGSGLSPREGSSSSKLVHPKGHHPLPPLSVWCWLTQLSQCMSETSVAEELQCDMESRLPSVSSLQCSLTPGA